MWYSWAKKNYCFHCWRFKNKTNKNKTTKTPNQPTPPPPPPKLSNNFFSMKMALFFSTFSVLKHGAGDTEEWKQPVPFSPLAPRYVFLGNIFVRIAKELKKL